MAPKEDQPKRRSTRLGSGTATPEKAPAEPPSSEGQNISSDSEKTVSAGNVDASVKRPKPSEASAERTRVNRKAPADITNKVSGTGISIGPSKLSKGTFLPQVDDVVSLEDIQKVLDDPEYPVRKLSSRLLAPCKRIDFDWFKNNGLDIEPMFCALTWRRFCEVLMNQKTFIFSIYDVCRLFESSIHENLKISEIEKSKSLLEKVIPLKALIWKVHLCL